MQNAEGILKKQILQSVIWAAVCGDGTSIATRYYAYQYVCNCQSSFVELVSVRKLSSLLNRDIIVFHREANAHLSYHSKT